MADNGLKEKYQQYKALYEQNATELTTYKIRVQDACTRINNTITELKNINNIPAEASYVMDMINELPECTEENVNQVAVAVRKCESELTAYCTRLINSVL